MSMKNALKNIKGCDQKVNTWNEHLKEFNTQEFKEYCKGYCHQSNSCIQLKQILSQVNADSTKVNTDSTHVNADSNPEVEKCNKEWSAIVSDRLKILKECKCEANEESKCDTTEDKKLSLLLYAI